MKTKTALILCFLFIGFFSMEAQFNESKARKKMWRKSARHRKKQEAFNPYLDKKHKPSQELSKQNAREQKRQLKAAKKQKRRNMKSLGIRPAKVKKA